MWKDIQKEIERAEGKQFAMRGTPRGVAGGCINEAWRIDLTCADEDGEPCSYFIKTNGAAFIEQFTAEADGLNALRLPDVVTVPRPVCVGSVGSVSYLALEYLEIDGPRSDAAEEMLGTCLANLHRVTSADEKFGWSRDNAIGATLQRNGFTDDWTEFFAENRLRAQFDLAAQKGRVFEHSSRFIDDIVPQVLKDHRPAPSLLHGDLWSGNVGYSHAGQPAVFDPAVYYGDRETDIAFTQMFGGFGPSFYRSYQDAWPLSQGHKLRAELYNLYHVLNHFNLFGGGYGQQADAIMRRLGRAV